MEIFKKLLLQYMFSTQKTNNDENNNNNDSYDKDLFNVLEPHFQTLRPKISEILSISHILCTNCCEYYTPCRVDNWIECNPELFDSEVWFFATIITVFNQYIDHDLQKIECDEEQEIYPNFVNSTTRLRQLYTVIMNEIEQA